MRLSNFAVAVVGVAKDIICSRTQDLLATPLFIYAPSITICEVLYCAVVQNKNILYF